MKKLLLNNLPYLLLTFLVCFALHQGLAAFLKVDFRWWIAVPVLLVWCFVMLLERFRGFRLTLALWIAGLVLCLLLSDRELLGEAALAAVNRTGEGNEYGELILLLVCTFAALPLSALMRFYWTRACLSLVWAALWITSAILEWPLPRLVPAAMIPLLLSTLSETIRRLRRESETGAALRRALVIGLLPAAALLIFLPAPSEPYGYPLLHQIAEKAEELWHDMETSLHFRYEGDREFGLSFNGVSDRAPVGEGSEDAEPSVIYVKAGKTPIGPVYLFANAWDSFDGRGWESRLAPETAESLSWNLDTAQRVYALWRMLGEKNDRVHFADYFRSNNIFFSCENIDMRTMFGVMNAMRINTDAERFPYTDTPTGVLFDYVQRDTVWYKIYYLESNARTRKALIDAAEKTAYSMQTRGPRWFRVAQSFGQSLQLDLRSDTDLEKVFAEREALIYDAYLDCTGVSERAAALAREITAGCESSYDKLSAIAGYLQKNYGYTTSPEPVPKGENFLDWLLFEKREGYCAWYATAAVLLSRSVGVPARYVQGYRTTLDGGVYKRLAPEDAHAWCEGYIAGYGWITVEATPGFEGEGEGWMPAADQLPNEAVPETSAIPEKTPTPAAEGETTETEEPLPEMPVPAEPGEITEGTVSAAEPEFSQFDWLSLAIVLLLASAALWYILRRRRQRRYALADPATRLTMDLEGLLRDLRGKGYPRAPEESLAQYFERLPSFIQVHDAEAQAMTALYDRTFFALKMPSELELARHRAFAARFRPRTLRQWITWYGLQ